MPSLVYRERNGVPLNNQAKVKEEASFARTGSLLNARLVGWGPEFVRGAGFGFRSFFVNKQSGEEQPALRLYLQTVICSWFRP
jgi:hypothetical protein